MWWESEGLFISTTIILSSVLPLTYGEEFRDMEMANLHSGMVLSSGLSASDHPTYCTIIETLSFWSLICPVDSPYNLVMIKL